MRFLVDADLPRPLAGALRSAGHEADDVRDLGGRAWPDEKVFEVAQKRGAILMSRDLGFANIAKCPPGSHAGIVVVRVPPTISIGHLIASIMGQLQAVSEADLHGTLTILEPGRLRIRRA